MQRIDRLKELPSQTAGPYVHIGCVPNFSGIEGVYPEDLGATMRRDGAKGIPITIRGCVWDGTGTALRDALIEVWQADADGLYPGTDPRGAADPTFSGWGRFAGDYESGEWEITTVKPGAVPFPGGGTQAPHITFWIVARGINIGLHTRMYFPDDSPAQTDPILMRIEHRNRISTLIAEPEGDNSYRFDIRLQGERETIFFDV
jgi:protocatechuate 3,4-dioxygenase alpha subunit